MHPCTDTFLIWASSHPVSAPCLLKQNKAVFCCCKMCLMHFFSSADSRIWQSLSGHEWDYSSVLPSKWRRCPLSHFGRKNIWGHFPLPGGPLQDHQATQSVLHGGGWCGTKGKDEPTKRTEIQVEMNIGWKKSQWEWKDKLSEAKAGYTLDKSPVHRGAHYQMLLC